MIDPILKDIATLTSHFESVDVSFIPRKPNLVAYVCAKSTYGKAVGSFVPIFPP